MAVSEPLYINELAVGSILSIERYPYSSNKTLYGVEFRHSVQKYKTLFRNDTKIPLPLPLYTMKLKKVKRVFFTIKSVLQFH